MDAHENIEDSPVMSSNRPIAKCEETKFEDFKWAHVFTRNDRGFFYCTSACLILLSLDLETKTKYSQILKTMSRDFRHVLNKCETVGLNFHIFREFTKIFELTLFASTSAIGFSYLRYYLEKSDRNMSVCFDYAMRFFFFTLLINENKKSKALSGKANEIWMNCLELLSVNYNIKFQVFEANILRSIESSKAIFTCYLKKEGRRFSLLYKDKSFDNFDQEFILDRSLWTFNYIEDEIPSDSSPLNQSNDQGITRRTNSIDQDVCKLRVRIFLKVSDIILQFYNIPIPNDDNKGHFFSKNSIIKYITTSGMKFYFMKFLPLQDYDTTNLFLVSQQIHVIFESRSISNYDFARIMNSHFYSESSKLVTKDLIIDIIVDVINYYA